MVIRFSRYKLRDCNNRQRYKKAMAILDRVNKFWLSL